jgi:hypothetical protein
LEHYTISARCTKAIINCTKAKALRQRLRKEWLLPADHFLDYTGKDWIILLNQVDDVMRAKLLLLWWRTWHLRNNTLFGDGKCSIEHSAIFLQSYLSLFHDNTDCELLADPKGKQPAYSQGATSSQTQRITEASWSKPDQGWAKLNFDASFLQEDNSGAWGGRPER